MQKIRILFSKTDTAKFISHLDLVRVITRAMKRAEIPIVYSQGFNPSPKLNFALPLSLGQQSLCEIMNFKVEPDMDCSIIKEKLQIQLPDGIKLLKVYVPDDLSDDFYYTSYDITVNEPISTDLIKLCFDRNEIFVVKRTKSGESLTDIKPFIISVEVSGIDTIIIKCILNSKDPHFLNPEYIIKALREYTGLKIDDYSILRTEIFTENLKIYR